MSQTGQFRQYAEESDPPRRRISSPWKFTPASPKTSSEYHLSIWPPAFRTAGLRRWPGLANAPVRRTCRLGISSTVTFGSSTTIRGERKVDAGTNQVL